MSATAAGTLPPYLYKILTLSEWEAFQKERIFKGSELDLKDGFIHTSTETQYLQTLAKFFKPTDTVYIVKLDTSKLKHYKIKLEPSRPNKQAGELYYHIYDTISFDTVHNWMTVKSS